MTGKEKTRRFKGALLTAPFSPNHLQWYHKMDLIVAKAVRVRGNKVELSRRTIEEIRWNCKMARLGLQEAYRYPPHSYEKRCKNAIWYINFAILVYDEAIKRMNRNDKVRRSTQSKNPTELAIMRDNPILIRFPMNQKVMKLRKNPYVYLPHREEVRDDRRYG